jgi:hypothetical protein
MDNFRNVQLSEVVDRAIELHNGEFHPTSYYLLGNNCQCFVQNLARGFDSHVPPIGVMPLLTAFIPSDMCAYSCEGPDKPDAMVAMTKHAVCDFANGAEVDSIERLKLGPNVYVGEKGVQAAVNATLIKAEVENKTCKISTGLQVDTGVRIRSDGVKLSFLGFGLEADEEGVGFSLPFFSYKHKC